MRINSSLDQVSYLLLGVRYCAPSTRINLLVAGASWLVHRKGPRLMYYCGVHPPAHKTQHFRSIKDKRHLSTHNVIYLHDGVERHWAKSTEHRPLQQKKPLK